MLNKETAVGCCIWCHMSVMASQIIGNSTVCVDNIKEHIKALCCWHFLMGIYQWPVDSPHKGPVTRTHHYPLCRKSNFEVLMHGWFIINLKRFPAYYKYCFKSIIYTLHMRCKDITQLLLVIDVVLWFILFKLLTGDLLIVTIYISL